MGLRKQMEYLDALRTWIMLDVHSSSNDVQERFLNQIQNDRDLLEKGQSISFENYKELNNYLGKLGQTQLDLLRVDIVLSSAAVSYYTVLAAAKFKKVLNKKSYGHSSSESTVELF